MDDLVNESLVKLKNRRRFAVHIFISAAE